MRHIFGSWRDPRGIRAAKGTLHLKLNQDAVIPATGQAAPRGVSYTLDDSGALISGSQVWANDELLPTGTYYIASVNEVGGGLIWGPQNLYIAGGGKTGNDPIDLNLVVPLPGIAAIEGLAASGGQTVVFTRPPLQAGVIDARVSDLTTWAPSAFVTVSDQFILAATSGASIIASKSLDSLTASIIVSLDTENFPIFSAAALGQTVTNQIVLAGGSNLSLANSTDSRGMTVSFNVATDIDITTHPLVLAGGSNVTLESSSAASGTTVTINAGKVDVSLVPGANIGITQFTSLSGTTATISARDPDRGVSIIAGSNITVGSTTNTAGSTFTITGASPGGTFYGGMSGGNTVGQSGSVSNKLILAGGSNITLSGATNTAGMTVSIAGAAAGTGGGASFLGGISGGNTLGNTGTVSNQLVFAGGNNVTLSGSTNVAGMTVTVSAGAGGTGGGSFLAGISGGNTAGNTGTVSNQLVLAGANNITLSGSTNATGMTVSFSGAAFPNLALISGGGGTISSGTTGSFVSNALRFAAGSNVFLSQSNNSITINALATGGAGFLAGLDGFALNATTLGESGPVSNKLLLAAGPWVTLSGATDTAGMTASVEVRRPFFARFFTQAGGITTGTGWSGLSIALSGGLFFIAGSNIILSGSTDTAQALSMTVIGQKLSVVAGSNVTTATTSNSLGTTVTIDALGGTGGGGPVFSAGVSSGNQGSIAGNNTQFTGTVSNQFVMYPGANMTYYPSTNSAGMSLSIAGPKAAASIGIALPAGANSTIGSTSGFTDRLGYSFLHLVAGSNILLSVASATNAQGSTNGSITINAPVAALPADSRYLGAVLPILPVNGTIGTFVHNSVMFWPFQMSAEGGNFSVVNIPLFMNMATSGSHIGTLGISLGVYTRNGSSLVQGGSVNWTTHWSTSNPNNLLGLRIISIPWSHSFDPMKDHWMAFRLSSSTSSQAFTVSAYVYQAQPPTGLFNQPPANVQLVPGWGTYSATSFPSTIAISAIEHAINLEGNTPIFYFAGFSA